MQRKILFITTIALTMCIFQSCIQVNKCEEQIAGVEKKYQDSIALYQDSIASLNKQLKKANEQIRILEFPSDQRFSIIQTLYNNHEYDSVRRKITELKSVFPNSKEIKDCDILLSQIETIESEKKQKKKDLKH